MKMCVFYSVCGLLLLTGRVLAGGGPVSITGALSVERGGRADDLIMQGDSVTVTFRVQNGVNNSLYYSIKRLNITEEHQVTSGVDIYRNGVLRITGSAARRYSITRTLQATTVVTSMNIRGVVAGDRADYSLSYADPSSAPLTGGRVSVPIIGDRPRVSVMQGRWFLGNASLSYTRLQNGSTLTLDQEDYLSHHGFNYSFDAEFGCVALYNFPQPILETISLGDKDVTSEFRHKTQRSAQFVDDVQIIRLERTLTDASRGHGDMNSYIPSRDDYGQTLRCEYLSSMYGRVAASVTFKFTGKPSVNCTHDDHIHNLGEDARITCEVLSNPMLTDYHFMTPLGYNMSKGNDDSNYTTTFEALGDERYRVILHVNGLREDQAGLYSVFATNAIGTDGELHATAIQLAQPGSSGTRSSSLLAPLLVLLLALLY